MAGKINSGKYTIFDERGFFNSYQKPGTVTETDLKFHALDVAQKNVIISTTKFYNPDLAGRFTDAFDASHDINWPGRVVKTTDEPGTVIDTRPKPVVDPGHDPKKPNTGNKKDNGGKTKTIGSIFSGLFSRDKKGKLTPAETMMMKKIGGNTPIRYTPDGKPYVTKAGSYQGKPGQWTSYKGSGGNTITFFNPADNSPPSNFYSF